MHDDTPVDVLFDVRTGYHVVTKPAGCFDGHPDGEGDPRFFAVIRCRRDELPVFWREPGGDDRRGRVPLCKLSRAAHFAGRDAARLPAAIPNVYGIDALVTEAASEEDFAARTAALDTRGNATLTVGTGKTYATISAAVAAADSGDTIAVYETGGNTYAENVSASGKSLQIVGLVPGRGITVAAEGTSACFYLGSSHGTLVRNFHFDATSTSGHGIDVTNSSGVTVAECSASGAGASKAGFYNWNSGCTFVNCVSWDNGYGFRFAQSGNAVNCTACKNSTAGFYGSNYTLALVLCLAAGNGTDFDRSASGPDACMLCASADSSVFGTGSAIGFNTADFTEYAEDDFTLNVTSTEARFEGYPPVRDDFDGGARRTGGFPNHVYAGASDPDPDVPSVPGVPAWDGAPTPGDAQAVLHFTADDPADVIYARYRIDGGPWSEEDEGFKRAGSGDITVTGLNNGTAYRFSAYSKNDSYTSDWLEPRVCRPESSGGGTEWSPALAVMASDWEGIF
ncbi:MAG: right-handed parallel beta-helix repeat-containing protein [Planctomycetes bacterium]|nr:right-handed parallel beta-helix repeat-containing protein [Planctomycetota bacterium]